MEDLRLGNWSEALADVESIDCLMTDPPYGDRVHKGDAAAAVQQKNVQEIRGYSTVRRPVEYSSFDAEKVAKLVEFWQGRNRGWWICMTSHDLIPAWERAYKKAGLYSFAPVPFIRKVPRLLGDGPASWADYIMVARPRTIEFSRWGCLPGAYVLPEGYYENAKIAVGGKPIWLMRCLVRDYTKPGDVICDPFAGGGTTLVAAKMEDRKAIGAEIDEETHKKAFARLRRPVTGNLFCE